MKSNIFLQFDFNTLNGAKDAPLLFSEPKKIITTYQLSEVSTCLQQMDEEVDKGFYVAGYFSYEMIFALLGEEKKHMKNVMPLLWFGVFHKPAVQLEPFETGTENYDVGEWKMQVSKTDYEGSFYTIMDAIKRKEIEQINYTVPFHANFSGNTYNYYQQLKTAQQSNFCAYLHIDEQQILSASPELFFHKKDGNISVRPMKGTVHRGKTYEEDQQLKRSLQTSEKNKIENEIIVQLMKKELEKVTEKNSIHLHHPYYVEKYPTVYQMTSSLRGKLLPNLSVMDILKTLFPCGSISGMPKEASLKLIESIEKHPREVYCGAIGYITPNKDAIFNVPIRTVWVDKRNGVAHYGAGGAITEKSQMEDEYQEVLTKTDVLTWKRPDFKLLETLAIYNGSIVVLEEHLERLIHSAAYFDISLRIKRIRQQLKELEKKYTEGNWKARLTVSQNGKENIEISPLEITIKNQVMFAQNPVDKKNVFLYHKTTHRSFYKVHQQNEKILDVLLWNEDGEVTEFTIGNLVVELDGKLFTPPVSSGLLPGTFRKKLLQEEKITERKILKTDVIYCSKIWLINSVRKWIEVQLVSTH